MSDGQGKLYEGVGCFFLALAVAVLLLVAHHIGWIKEVK